MRGTGAEFHPSADRWPGGTGGATLAGRMNDGPDVEALAKQLKADGYNAGVVARKLIAQHGVDEARAVAVTSAVFGTKADPRLGDTTTGVLTGLGITALGLGGIALMWASSTLDVGVVFACIGVTGVGLAKLVKTLVNAGAPTELR